MWERSDEQLDEELDIALKLMQGGQLQKRKKMAACVITVFCMLALLFVYFTGLSLLVQEHKPAEKLIESFDSPF